MVEQNHILDQIPAYALGCLDESEALEAAEHLAVCASCRDELRTYQNLADLLPFGLAQTEPPIQVKQRLIGKISAPLLSTPAAAAPTWFQRLIAALKRSTPAWGLASLVVVALLAVSNLSLRQQFNQLSQVEMPVFALRGSDYAPGAVGTIVVSRDGEHGALVVDGLGTLNPGQQYQLWLIRKGVRTSGGVFSVDIHGYATLYVESPQPLASYDSLGITIEPAGGSPGPTGPKVMGGEL